MVYRLFKKDFKLFFKDKRAVLLTFLLPIILISLFAFAFGGLGDGGSTRPIELLVADLDGTGSSTKIISELDSLEGLIIVQTDFDRAKEQVGKGDYAAVLIFHTGFEDSVNAGNDMPVELMYDQAREMEVGMLQPVLIGSLMSQVGQQTVVASIDTYLSENHPDLDQSIKNQILEEASSEDESPANFDFDSSLKMTSIVGEEKKANLGLIQAVAGTAIMMLLFSVAAIGTSILEEKENGTINRLLYSPLKPDSILYGKMFYAFVIAILQLTIMFVFSWLVFGLDLSTNVSALVLMILATGFAVSSFGIFLAAIAKTRQQAQGLSTLIILIMSAIGGSMIPLFIMPAIMKKIAVVSVNYWGIQGFYDIFWRDLPLIDILPRILVLMAIGLVMTMISVRLFKKTVMSLS